MAKKQTRRGVSMSQAIHTEAVAFCTENKLPLAQVAEAALRFAMDNAGCLVKVDGKLTFVWPPPTSSVKPAPPPVDYEPKRPWLDDARADAKARPIDDGGVPPVIDPHANQAGWQRDVVGEMPDAAPDPALATEIGDGARSQMGPGPHGSERVSRDDIRVVYDE